MARACISMVVLSPLSLDLLNFTSNSVLSDDIGWTNFGRARASSNFKVLFGWLLAAKTFQVHLLCSWKKETDLFGGCRSLLQEVLSFRWKQHVSNQCPLVIRRSLICFLEIAWKETTAMMRYSKIRCLSGSSRSTGKIGLFNLGLYDYSIGTMDNRAK